MAMRLALLACAAPLVAACAPADLPVGGLSVSHPQGSGKCDASAAQNFVQSKASQEIGFQILDATGARQLRWGGPDTAFTMDYREDRVNVIYEKSGMIERITCG